MKSKTRTVRTILAACLLDPVGARAAAGMLATAEEIGVADLPLDFPRTTTGALRPDIIADSNDIGDWEGEEEAAAEAFNSWAHGLLEAVDIEHAGGDQYISHAYLPEDWTEEEKEAWRDWEWKAQYVLSEYGSEMWEEFQIHWAS
jgi:hypothetical protein